MHVVAVNGSPRRKGNTFQLLELACQELNKEGITTEIIQIGGKQVYGCLACNQCFKLKNMQCVNNKDSMNEWMAKAFAADGLILGSPTYFANMTTEMKAFVDRVGFVNIANGRTALRHKVGSPLVVHRRAGAQQVYNGLMAFFGISEIFVATSSYWNMAVGLQEGAVQEDAEGLETIRTQAKNMAFLLKKIHQ